MECNGNLSIMPKSTYKPVTLKDLKLKEEQQGLCANVVIDGRIMDNNLKNMGKEIEWLRKQLDIKGYKNIDKILLATLDCNEKLTVYDKNEDKKIKNVLE